MISADSETGKEAAALNTRKVNGISTNAPAVTGPSSGDPQGLTAPSIAEYHVHPDSGKITSDSNVQIWYTAYSKVFPGSMTMQMLRAPDVNGGPGSWQVVKATTVSVDPHKRSPEILVDDKPAPGKYWYGVNVVDGHGHATREPAPVEVTVTGPPSGNPDDYNPQDSPALRAKTYKGDAAGFVANLLGYIDRAAAEHGVPAHSFDQEEAYIARLITLCTAISPQMAPRIFNDPTSDLPVFKDEKYKICGETGTRWITETLRGPGHENDWQIQMNWKVVGRSWAMPRGLDVDIDFRLRPQDDPFHGGDHSIVRAALNMNYQTASSSGAVGDGQR